MLQGRYIDNMQTCSYATISCCMLPIVTPHTIMSYLLLQKGRKGEWKQERKEGDDAHVATDVKYDNASSLSWSKSICNLESDITIIRGSIKTIVSFSKVNTKNIRGQVDMHLRLVHPSFRGFFAPWQNIFFEYGLHLSLVKVFVLSFLPPYSYSIGASFIIFLWNHPLLHACPQSSKYSSHPTFARKLRKKEKQL